MTNLVEPGTHRFISRGGDSVPESSLPFGRFGRMFRNLPSYSPDDGFLESLAQQMVEEGRGTDAETLPAGVTYLGQFIDHDLTFDPVSSLARQNDPDALTNFRTPVFDLDCVYGRGRDDQPYMYRGDEFLIGTAEGGNEKDLPRNSEQRALIGDPRNDENIIVGQLQLAFLLLHNRLLADLQDGGPLAEHRWSDEKPFEAAQRLARWHYQWLVVKFFLPAICDQAVWARYFDEDRIGGGLTCRRILELHHYKPKHRPYIPVEWSVAAYRFGHSMIRQKYHLNATLRGFRNGEPIDIFIENPTPEDRLQHLDGRRLLPPFWSIDWRMFFDFGEALEDLQPARKIDAKLAGGLQFLPGITDAAKQLAHRNLKRGKSMGLPSGEVLARRLCIRPLRRQQTGLDRDAPLWFYVLKEAEILGDGENLGPVGSTIVLETMLGMLAADPFSFLRTDPTWEPVIPPGGDDFGMAELLTYAVPDDGRRLQPPGDQAPPPPEGARSW
jgi:hypothetical protein